jgi:SSS family solute:Na+ symporter
MQLALIDWLAIAGYFLLSIFIGLYFRKRATASTADYFIGGRKVTWWLAGTSMVATTFAADTPHVDGVFLCPPVAPGGGYDRR